jgi:phage-related protein
VATNVEIIISGQNQAGGAFSDAASGLSGIGLAAGESNEHVSGFFSNMLSTAGGFLTANIIGGITSQFTGFFGSIISESKDAQEGQAQLQAVLTSTGGKAGVTADMVNELAGSLQLNTKFTDDQILSAENLLLTYTNISSEVFPDTTAAVLDLAQATGNDLKGASNMLGKALNDPIAGIGALSRVGVTFTDQQKAQIEAMMQVGDVAGAQKVILGELAVEFGGAAEAAGGTFAGKMEILHHRFDDMKQAIGDKVLPLLEKFADVLGSPAVLASIEAIADGLANGLGAAVATVSGLFDAFATGMEGGGILGGLSNLLYSLESVSPAFGLLGDAVTQLAPLFDQLAVAFSDGGIGGAFTYFSTQLASISPGFALLQAAVEAALPPIETIIVTTFGIISGFLATNGADIVAFVSQTWAQVNSIVQSLIPPIQAVVTTVFGAVAGFLTAHGAEIQAVLQMAWDTIKVVISGALDIIQTVVVPALTSIAGFISSHGAEIQTILGGVWQVLSGIVTAAMEIIQGVIKTVTAAIHGDWSGAWEAIKTMYSGVWESIQTIVQGAIDIIKGVLSLAWDAIKGTLESAWNSITTFFTGWWTTITTGFTVLTTAISTALSTAWTSIKTWVSTAVSDILTTTVDIGKNLVQGIINGITSMAGAITDAITGALNDALAAGKALLGIKSPSRVAAEQLGTPFMQGVAVGIEAMAHLPATALKTSLAATLDTGKELITEKAFSTGELFGVELSKGLDASTRDLALAKALGDISLGNPLGDISLDTPRAKGINLDSPRTSRGTLGDTLGLGELGVSSGIGDAIDRLMGDALGRINLDSPIARGRDLSDSLSLGRSLGENAGLRSTAPLGIRPDGSASPAQASTPSQTTITGDTYQIHLPESIGTSGVQAHEVKDMLKDVLRDLGRDGEINLRTGGSF